MFLVSIAYILKGKYIEKTINTKSVDMVYTTIDGQFVARYIGDLMWVSSDYEIKFIRVKNGENKDAE
jgi:hypothetical protein